MTSARERLLEFYSAKTAQCSGIGSDVGTVINLGEVNTIPYVCTAWTASRRLAT